MSSTGAIDAGLEVVVVPVDDVDRAKQFYAGLGWRLDAEVAAGDAFRLVQFTPPGSACSIQFGVGLTPAAPGSAQGLYLVVSDVEAARADLEARGAAVSEVFHEEARGHGAGAGRRGAADVSSDYDASVPEDFKRRALRQDLSRGAPATVPAPR
jgi:catechol 2,3-dioxygenase-like lactoylglutathione lyase family enzyme